MNALVRLWCEIFVLSLLPVFAASAVEPERAGDLKDLGGEVSLITKLHANPRKLDAEVDRYRTLFVGETLHLGPNAQVDLVIGGEPIHKDGPCDYTVPSVEETQPSETMKAIRHFAATGGRTRGGAPRTSAVFSPARDSCVWPPDLVIRWIPKSDTGSVSLVILDENKTVLWQRDGVLDAAGSFDSDEFRKTLSNREDSFLLYMIQAGERTRVSFSTLSTNQKAALDKELSAWDRESDQGFRSIGRAYVYSKFGMFNEVADEYEAALRIAPRSRSLLIAAVIAQHRTGNIRREKQLRAQLPRDVNQEDLE